jgi:TolB-like protein
VKKYIVVLYFLLIGGVFAFAQKRVSTVNTLAQVILFVQQQIETELALKPVEEELPPKPKVVVYALSVILQNQRHPTNRLSDYVLEQIVAALTRGGKLNVPSRSDIMLAARQKEINFQTSGEVDEDEMSAIGHAMGADFVVSGTLQEFSDYYEFNLMIAAIKAILNIAPVQIRLNKNDKQMKDLLGITGEEQEEAKRKRDAKRKAWLNEQSNRDSRLVVGAQAGVSLMFSNHEGDMYPDESTLTYGDEGATAFTGQFSLGVNWVGRKPMGFRLNGVFSLNEGLTTTIKDKITAESQTLLEFSYSTFDLGLLVEFAPSAQTILFTFYLGPYISLPVSDLKLKIGGTEISGAELKPFAGPIGNIGALAGLNVGYKVGLTGYIVLDVRYKYDFLPTKFSAAGLDNAEYNDPIDFYHRHGLQLTLGYEFWI